MNLGAFSISLSVKDLERSRDFYEKLGFNSIGGSEDQNYLIMQNNQHLIGIFQDMFESNILTFNPGFDQDGKLVDSFTDIRDVQKEVQAADIPIDNPIDDDSTEGPASFMITDPDGNLILVDQHR